jgi:T-complex protein 1 subunit theta
VCETCEDVRDLPKVIRSLTSAISAKQNGYERLFAPLVAQACLYALPSDKQHVANFNVDDVRVAKIVGGGVTEATVLRGVVCTRDAEGTVKAVQNAHVAVYQHGT